MNFPNKDDPVLIPGTPEYEKRKEKLYGYDHFDALIQQFMKMYKLKPEARIELFNTMIKYWPE